MDDTLIEPTAKYREATLEIGRWELFYSPRRGFGLTLAGELTLGDETMKVNEITLCVAAAASHYLSSHYTVEPDGIGVIDTESCDQGVLIVAPADPVTIFNLLESGHRPPLRMEGMLEGSGRYRITHMRFYVASK